MILHLLSYVSTFLEFCVREHLQWIETQVLVHETIEGFVVDGWQKIVHHLWLSDMVLAK